jgi:hypothetical protein
MSSEDQDNNFNAYGFGIVVGRQQAQDERIADIKAGQVVVLDKLDKILAIQNKQKGAITASTAIATAIASFIAWATTLWLGIKP